MGKATRIGGGKYINNTENVVGDAACIMNIAIQVNLTNKLLITSC